MCFFKINIVQSQSFHNLDAGFNYPVYSLFHDNDDSILYAGGWFYLQGTDTMRNIAQWDGIKWDSLGSGGNDGGNVRAITKYNGNLFVGGTFSKIGGVVSKGLATWNGMSWNYFGDFSNGGYGYVLELLVNNNDLYIGGGFDSINGVPANGLVKYDGSNFWVYPSIGSSFTAITSIAFYNGELYVGGNFDPGLGKNDIAKFDGTNWVSVGGGLSGGATIVDDMIVYNGELYISGHFLTAYGDPGDLIAKWNGTSWSSVGSGLIGGNCFDLEIVNNELYVGGSLLSAGGIPITHMAKWNGGVWSSTGANIDAAILCFDATNDNLFIGGGFQTINGDTMNHISRYDLLTGTNEIEQLTYFESFPNPTSNNFTICFPANNEFGNLELINTLGEVVFKEVISPLCESKQMDISSLTCGVYFCRCYWRDSNSVIKLIKN